ncbi:MAG: DUF3108 domain-containing protein [Pyrinomonadaceae bacterium]
MKGSLQKPRAVVLLILALAAAAYTQSPAKAAAPKPFKPGETLTYEGKLSKIIVSSVAELTMKVESGSPEPDSGYLIKASARSKGTLLSLFRYSFLYEFASDVDGSNFRIERTVRKTTEKDRVRSGEARFNYGERLVTYLETDPNEPMRPPRKIASAIGEQTLDVVSGVYALRLLPLEIGKKFVLTVSDSGLVYEVPIAVTGRELQKTILGRVWCYRVEPDVFGPNRMIENEGKMTIWITDDARRVPVRSVINASIGKIEIRLRAASNLR